MTEYVSTLLACSKELEGMEHSISNKTFIIYILTTLSSKLNLIGYIITHQLATDQTINNIISTLIWRDNS
jgi:hypothetical protein